MELITWAWIIIIVIVFGFIIYYLLKPTEKRDYLTKENLIEKEEKLKDENREGKGNNK